MDYTEYLQWHQIALTNLGLWPMPDSSGSLSSAYSVYSIIFLGTFCLAFNVSEFINFFFIYSELKTFASDLCWFLVHFVTSFKIVVFLSKISNIQMICSRFVNGLLISDLKRGAKEAEIFHYAVKRSVRYLAVYYTLSVAVLLNSFIAPVYRDDEYSESNSVLNNTRSLSHRLPYNTYVYCNPQISPCYEISYIYQIISTCVFSLVIIHCDNLYIVLVMLCCSEFKILRRSLEEITNRYNDDNENRVIIKTTDIFNGAGKYKTEDDDKEREIIRRVISCVKHHHAILEVSEELEDMYNLLILAQFLCHVIQICFQMFLVTEVSALSFDGLSMIAFVVAMVIEVYVFCQCGSEIETESTKVSEAAYNAQWMSSSEPVKRTLLLMMLRAQRPVQFTVGKFAKLSLGTLVSVLKGSFSYFTVLRGIQ